MSSPLSQPDVHRAWLTLLAANGLGPVTQRRLLQQFTSPTRVLAASDALLRAAGGSAAQVQALRHADIDRVEAALEWLALPGHSLVTVSDPAYPASFDNIDSAPLALFCAGDTDLLQMPGLAIVGSRHPTRGGSENAARFAAWVAERGIAVVSGLAQGIDAAAHQAALDAGGATIAVLGTGPDRYYPRQNQALQQRIASEGLVISEYLPGQPPATGQFPARNRLLAGLSLGVLVVEATKRSGSLITARLAGEQGRSVFAIPGSIHNPLARGCHQLIRQGALLVESGEDLLLELGPRLADAGARPQARPSVSPAAAVKQDLERDHQVLLEAMAWDPVSIDELVQRTSLTAAEVSSMLLIMELEGKVESLPGGGFARCR